MGLFAVVQEVAPVPGASPDAAPQRPVREVAFSSRLGGWAVEAAALTALFLLIQGRTGAWWLDGLVAGWIAWVFRGPILALTMAAWSRLPAEHWWKLSQRWFLLYSLCGIAVAIAARRLGVRRAPDPKGVEA
jgi:hypothetical protein